VHHRRLVFGFRCRSRGGDRGVGDRVRYRRVDPDARLVLRHNRSAPHARAHQPAGFAALIGATAPRTTAPRSVTGLKIAYADEHLLDIIAAYQDALTGIHL
jgi:hypothetical protein